MTGQMDEMRALALEKIEDLRPRLLDLTRRNPLLSVPMGSRTTQYIRIVDELPDILFHKLQNGTAMRIIPLPALEEELPDEQTEEFQNALSEAYLTDEEYLQAMESIDSAEESNLDEIGRIERDLKDRVREHLGYLPRQTPDKLNLRDHAKNVGIDPSYELPKPPDDEDYSHQHGDDDIQTLYLPDQLERQLNKIRAKTNELLQEAGINVLHLAFGLLQWQDKKDTKKYLAPLVLLPLKLERTRTVTGFEFSISLNEDEAFLNNVLTEKLKADFGMEFPAFEGGSLEDYFASLTNELPAEFQGDVKRQVVLGNFPSARMAMYNDLDTSAEGFNLGGVVANLLVGEEGSGDSAPSFGEDYPPDEPEYANKVPYTVLDADSSQFSCIVDVVDGKNVALEGPPGTGKSQTIVNVIAAALAEGKKVLFVSEKAAALNVVKSRLEAVALGDFVLSLQASKSERGPFLEGLERRLDLPRRGAGTGYDRVRSDLDKAKGKLKNYVDIMSSPFGDSGFTVHEIMGHRISSDEILRQVPKTIVSAFDVSGEHKTKDGIRSFLKEVGDFEVALSEYRKSDSRWKGSAFLAPTRLDEDRIVEEITDVSTLLRSQVVLREELQSQLGDINVDALPQAKEALTLLAHSLKSDETIDELGLQQLLEESRAFEALDAALNILTLEERVLAALSGDLTEDTSTTVGKLIAAILELNVGSVNKSDLSPIDAAVTAQLERENALKLLLSVIDDLAVRVPDIAAWKLASVAGLRAALQNVTEDVLALRQPSLESYDHRLRLRKEVEEGAQLQAEKQELSKVFDLNIEVELNDLEHAVKALRKAGRFSFLSPATRKARAFHSGISREKKKNISVILQNLELYHQWMRQLLDFEQRTSLKNILGSSYRSLDTDFTSFNQLLSLYDFLESDLNGADQWSLKQFALNGRAVDLVLLSRFEVPQNEGTIADVLSERGQLERTSQRFEQHARAAKEHAQVLRADRDYTVDDLKAIVADIDNAETLDAAAQHYTSFWEDLDAAWPTWDQSLEQVIDFFKSYSELKRITGGTKWYTNQEQIAQLLDRIESFLKKQSDLTTMEEQLCLKTGINIDEVGQDARAKEWEVIAADRQGLITNSSYQAFLNALPEAAKLRPVIDSWVEGQCGDCSLSKVVSALLYHVLITDVYNHYPIELAGFSGLTLDRARKDLAKLDLQLIEESKKKLVSELLGKARPPSGFKAGKKSNWTEMALLEHQMGLQRPSVSVRNLVKRARQSLLELKPCWMMSPLAVAQYLPADDNLFDLCIIDEASQMPPENSLSALQRCKQTLIVGDTNQLPPTRLFQKIVEDDDDDDEADPILEESILEMANAMFRPARRLRWHYRSKDPSLIQYSNHMVYDNSLVVFPSANTGRHNMGVSYRPVEGLYASGTNPKEAEAVVVAIEKFMRDEPNRSLGVVAMNKKQAELIEELFNHSVQKHSHMADYIEAWETRNEGLEQVFIKNLENVQGDERDVIFISTVYGPATPGGKVMQRFGPVNGVAGKRRLNVLFSRAKEQIITFSSMREVDILDDGNNPGRMMLKGWLGYCATGTLSGRPHPSGETDSPFEDFVIQQINSMGCVPEPQVGVKGYSIDIGVRHPEWPHGYVLGVECDGATYHSSKSARDRDRLRQEVLESLGWTLHRIWSVDWFRDPRAEAEKLRQRIRERLEHLKATADHYQTVPTDEPTTEVIEENTHEAHEFNLEPTDEAEAPEVPLFTRIAQDEIHVVEVGDKVGVEYHDDPDKQVFFVIDERITDPGGGIVHQSSPIAQALLGAELDDDVEILVASRIRGVRIISIDKQH